MTSDFILILISYFFILISIGFFNRKSKNRLDFYLGNKKFNLLTTTFSLTVTGIGGSATIISFLYIVKYGLAGIWLNLSASIGLLILGLFFTDKMRKLNIITLPELAEKFYGKNIGITSAILIIFTQIGWIALLIQANTILLKSLNLKITYSIYLTTAIFIIYTILGGQKAVSYSDNFQFIIIFIGIICLGTFYSIKNIDNFNKLLLINKELISFPTNSKFGFIDIFSTFILMGLPHIIGPDITSKILSAKDNKTAKLSSILSAIIRAIWGLVIAIIAFSIMYKLNSNKIKFSDIFISLTSNKYIIYILVLSFISVIMSSADTILITNFTIFEDYILNKYLNINIKKIKFIKIYIVIIGITAMFIALYFKNILNTLKFFYTVYSSTIIIPLLLGFFKKKLAINSKAINISIIITILSLLIFKLNIINININITIFNMFLNLLLIILFSYIFNKREKI